MVIADNSDAPILFATENGTEYFPCESVYAVGEIKSTYYRSKKYVEAFADTVARIKSQLNRRPTPPTYLGGDIDPDPSQATLTANVPYRNPLFSFMVFVNANDFSPDDLLELYTSRPTNQLPNTVCFLDKGIIISQKIRMQDGRHHVELNPVPEWLEEPEPGSEGQSRWVFNELDAGASFGCLYLLMMEHLRRSQLYSPELLQYLNSFFWHSFKNYHALT